ncbi:MAG: GGDEF domain-containing protein [Lachnospiraceae bacterium]|nr:GGDEF domain-containing protein [Lachnospiraceae bacterium]
MESKIINETKKNQLIMHRIVYFVFFVEGMILAVFGQNGERIPSVAVLLLLAICIIFEELMAHNKFFKKNEIRKWTRLGQCLLASAIFCFWQGMNTSELIAFTLIVMFMVDFFRVAEIEKASSIYFYVLCVAVPTLLAMIAMTINEDVSDWTYLIFNIAVLFTVLAVESCEFVNYVVKKDRIILDQRRKFADEVEKNADMLEIQQKMKDTNMMLNEQKVELQNANRKIQMANQEMRVQTDILRYIASSFDMIEILNQIAEIIMETRKLEFCAVYIEKDVYLNKHASYSVKCKTEGLDTKMKENLKETYQYMSAHNIRENIFHEELKEQFPFLKHENIHSMYLKLLEHEDTGYGLFVVGSEKRNAFTDNLSFYDVVIAQYDIAVTNIKNYNEMQRMARKDGLTGINNRVYFNQLFKERTEMVVTKNSCMSVALLDIDKFKSVNDTYGHLAGDEVIKRVASITEEVIECYDGFVCRYGGEEFVAVLTDHNLDAAKPIIEELFEKLCKQIVEYNEFKIPISVSVGLTAYPEVCSNPEELLKRSDWCMYYAKEHGRHQIKVDDGNIKKA